MQTGGMRVVGNILWLVLAGWWLALAHLLAGVVMCLLIVTIPFGVQSFKLASYALWPFGRVVVPRDGANPPLGLAGNNLWLLLGGLELTVGYLVAGALLCITIVGIPLGVGAFKLVPLALFPFGKDVVPADSLPPGTYSYGSAFQIA
jgi:uncharacterized membrane protein YccF (DUF307 family)